MNFVILMMSLTTASWDVSVQQFETLEQCKAHIETMIKEPDTAYGCAEIDWE